MQTRSPVKRLIFGSQRRKLMFLERTMIMNLKTVQKRIIQNKIKKGFNTTDIEKEFGSLQIELDEALDAYRNKSIEDVAEELADVAIFTLGIAEILGIDMAKAIECKLEKNERRVYITDENGEPVKLGAVYSPSGELIGYPLSKISLNSEGKIDLDELVDTFETFRGKYYDSPYTLQDLSDLDIVRFDKNEIETIELFEIEDIQNDYKDKPNTLGESLLKFFRIDTTTTPPEDVEFILLYRMGTDDNGEVSYVIFTLTYLKTYERFISKAKKTD